MAATNRHLSGLIDELKDIAGRLDITDLRDVDAARIADAELTALLTPDDVPGLDAAAIETRDVTITTPTTHAHDEDTLPPETNDRQARRVRIYRARGAMRRTGALVFLHGGAFCLGSLETDHLRCLLYAQEIECMVVSVEYALAPEHPFPAGFDDAVAALRWVHSVADDLGVDRRRICVGGESAGGALAAAVALHCRDQRELELCGQMLLFPVIDHRLHTPSMRAGHDMPAWNTVQSTLMWGHYLGDAGVNGLVSPYAAPALADDLTGLPPSLVVTAQIDPLRDEALEYAMRLCAAGVKTEIHNYPGTFHVFDGAAPHLEVSQRALREQIAFLRTVLADGADDAS